MYMSVYICICISHKLILVSFYRIAHNIPVFNSRGHPVCLKLVTTANFYLLNNLHVHVQLYERVHVCETNLSKM